MPKIKLNKHEVYRLISENLDWFETRSGAVAFRYAAEIEMKINDLLKKSYPVNPADPSYDPPQIKLYGSTLTAMVRDGVMDRLKESPQDVYKYHPVLPINEEY